MGAQRLADLGVSLDDAPDEQVSIVDSLQRRTRLLHEKLSNMRSDMGSSSTEAGRSSRTDPRVVTPGPSDSLELKAEEEVEEAEELIQFVKRLVAVLTKMCP